MPDALQQRVLRLRFAVRLPLAECHPPVLLNKLTTAFVSAGMPLALGKGKRPRPIAHLAYPLPRGVEGLEEWADITLAAGLPHPMDVAIEKLKMCSPAGLEILGAEQIPLHASSVADLCETACWLWLCPDALFHDAKPKMENFINSKSFQIAKTGKVEGKKSTKFVEVRHLMQGLAWDENAMNALRFSTKIVQGQAVNPQKIFAGILDVDPGQLGEIQRERIVLKPDTKLDRHDKFALKLRNLYEDAVLLESSPSIKIYEDDEDGYLSL